MPQPMKPAPSASEGMQALREWLLDKTQRAAGMVSPTPYSPLAALVAGLRSMHPDRGTFRQEYQRYNEAAAPDDSVMDRNPLPGESSLDFTMRTQNSPAVERDVMQAAGMAAPIVVHASPVKWSGQPTRAKAGTGEGGAAYGEGLYGSIPANAKGIDARYREQGLADWTVSPVEGKAAVIERLRRFAMEEQDKYMRSGTVRSQPGDPMPIAPEAYPALKQAEFLESQYQGTLEPWEARDMVKRYTNGTQHVDDLVKAPDRGSFHVWDVPDTLLDWDAPLKQQDASVIGALHSSDLLPDVVPMAEVAVKDRPFGWHPDDKAVMLGGKATGRAASWMDAGDITGRGIRDLVEQAGDVPAGDALGATGIVGHRYLGEAGSSGEAQGVPNFVIYDDAAVKPLGTFNSADEFLSSPLYKQLEPRIRAEEAALVERYPHLRSYFGIKE